MLTQSTVHSSQSTVDSSSTALRLAWFSPLPPVRSGIAADNAELLQLLERDYRIDRFDEPRAHDFVWKHRRKPYGLNVYQLGNARYHDYIWAYLARYPGLVVVHDPKLHHARARQLLSDKRFDDYRHEFWYDHPDARRDFVEYAVAGLGGEIYYFWSMLRVVVRTARLVVVNNPRVAADLREEFPGVAIEAIRLGKSPLRADEAVRREMRARLGIAASTTLFAAFGKVTAEKRVDAIVRAFARLVSEGADVGLVLAGDAGDYPTLEGDLDAAGLRGRVHVAGYVDDDAIGPYLAAADVCLCLRWPTAQETSGSWLHCLAARRATVITDLAHLVDVPSSVALRVDLIDEDASLEAAMRALASDTGLRGRIAAAGYDYWTANHTMAHTADDYRRVIAQAAALPAPAPANLPAHFTRDYSDRARAIAAQVGVAVDIL